MGKFNYLDRKFLASFIICTILGISLSLGVIPSLAQKLDEEQTPKVEEYLSQGKSYYRQDKFQEAIDIWQKVLEIDPTNSRALGYIERAKKRHRLTERKKHQEKYRLAKALTKKIAEKKEAEIHRRKEAERKWAKAQREAKRKNQTKLSESQKYKRALAKAIKERETHIKAEARRKQKEKKKAVAEVKKKKREEEKRLARLKREEEQKKREEKRKKKQEERRLAKLKREEEKQKKEAEAKTPEFGEKAHQRREEQKKRQEKYRLAKALAKKIAEKKEAEMRRAGEAVAEAPVRRDLGEEVSKTPKTLIIPDLKEYELALCKAQDKLAQLQKERVTLLAKIEQAKIIQKNQIEEYLTKGERYYQKGNYTSAIKEWSKALALDLTNTKTQTYIRKAIEALRKSTNN